MNPNGNGADQIVRTSAELDQFAAAFAAVQADIDNPSKNREVEVSTRGGAKYKFRYATLDHILQKARPLLAENGISVLQPLAYAEGKSFLVTRLLHKSGQWMESVAQLNGAGGAPQDLGSEITYKRRYQLASILGIASDEDDDGNKAAGNEVRVVEDRDPQQTGFVYVTKQGKALQVRNAAEWRGEWIGMVGEFVRAKDWDGLRAAWDRNREAIARAKRKNQEAGQAVEGAIRDALGIDGQPGEYKPPASGDDALSREVDGYVGGMEKKLARPAGALQDSMPGGVSRGAGEGIPYLDTDGKPRSAPTPKGWQQQVEGVLADLMDDPRGLFSWERDMMPILDSIRAASPGGAKIADKGLELIAEAKERATALERAGA